MIDANEAQNSGGTSGETTPRAKSPGNLTDDERLRIEEAVANQRKSIETLKKLVSSQNISNQGSTFEKKPSAKKFSRYHSKLESSVLSEHGK